jgi:AcrR family transcriptional regulator
VYVVPNLTKNAIKQSFIKLLNERPLKQITVRDIVDDCGFNRNSFYYHFADIPTLLKEIIMDEATRIITGHPSISSIEDCMTEVLHFARENKRAIMHIYNSVSRDIYEQYLWRVCEYAVTAYINSILGEMKVEQFDKDVIINFYKCACFGQILDWQRGGMKSDIKKQYMRMCEIKKGIIEDIAARIEVKDTE